MQAGLLRDLSLDQAGDWMMMFMPSTLNDVFYPDLCWPSRNAARSPVKMRPRRQARCIIARRSYPRLSGKGEGTAWGDC